MKRILTSIVLIFFVFSASSLVYANVKDETTYLDNISEFYLVQERLVSETNSTLIPVGTIQGVNDVYYVEYQYELLIKEGTDLNTTVKDLYLRTGDLTQEELEQVFVFDFDYEIEETVEYHESLFAPGVAANRVNVTLRVSMVEPESYEVFQELVGSQMSFEVYFFVV